MRADAAVWAVTECSTDPEFWAGDGLRADPVVWAVTEGSVAPDFWAEPKLCPDAGAPAAPAPPDSGSSASSNSSNPNRSSASCTYDALAGAAVLSSVRPEAAASFMAASKRSGSLVPRRLSGSISSSEESSGRPFRDPAWAESPGGDGATPTGTPSSMGASTGRSASGSKTGRDAASIISSLVDASSNANQCPRNRHDSLAGFRTP